MSTIDLRQWDNHQHSSRINADGSIELQDGELSELRAKLWLAENIGQAPSVEGLKAMEIVK
jgi:hypothetical protein